MGSIREVATKELANICEFCGDDGIITCHRCENTSYCCKEHQRLHWNEHSTECKSFKVKYSPEVGQYVVASRNLKAGNEIISDEPLAIGPMGNSDLLCLACYKPITGPNFYTCPDCMWPMCSLKCACSLVHDDECEILMNDNKHSGAPTSYGETPRYDLILILRCLLLKKNNSQSWKEILNMESHWESKKQGGDPYHNAAVQYLKRVCQDLYDENTIHHVRGALTTNCFQIRGPYESQLRALYPIIRYLNHSCQPNVYLSSTSSGTMKARACVDILKGQELNICYTSTDCSLLERRQNLLVSYYFTCRCLRCSDPTELGTYFSNPRCLHCRKELLVSIISKPSSSSASNTPTIWWCNRCNLQNSQEELLQEAQEWLFRLEMNDLFGSGTPLKIYSALKTVESNFHSKHFIFLKTCQLALNKLASNTSIEALKLKKEIWIYLLQIYSILEPGISKRKGMNLCKLARATFHYAKAGQEQQELSSYQVKNLYNESFALYNEAYHILKLEPRESSEAQLGLSLSVKMEEITLLLNEC